MKKPLVTLLAILSLSTGLPALAAPPPSPPLKLVQRFRCRPTSRAASTIFAVDVEGSRLFLAAEGDKAVLVIDATTGQVVHTLAGFTQPRAVLYRHDLGALYVIDGKGEMKIYDGNSYRPVRTTRLDSGAGAIGYDPSTKYLYVDTSAPEPPDPKAAKVARPAPGTRAANEAPEPKRSTTSSLFNMVDTSSGYKGTDMTIDGTALEAMALETDGPLIYVNNAGKNEVDVINRDDWRLVARWPVTMGQHNVAIALDEASHRLFVGCTSGQIVVFNTEEGKEIKVLPVAGGIDDLTFDPLSHRLYAASGSGGGLVDVYHADETPDHFTSLGRVSSGPDGHTALLVPDLHRYFVAVPAHGSDPAQVLVYRRITLVLSCGF